MTEIPKLLIVADTYYPKVDGTLKFIEEFMKRTQNSFQTSLLVPFLGKKRGENVTFITPSKIFSISGYPNMKLSFKNIRKIKETIKKADIVFVQGPALISYLSIYYSKKFKKKTIFYTHTIAWELFETFFPPLINKIFFNLIKRGSIFLYNRCDEIFVPYRELTDHLKRAGVKTKMNITQLGVDISIFTPSENKKEDKQKMNIPSDKFVIGYVGRISKEKNTDILLKAFTKIKDKNAHLVIVGDGPSDQVKKFKNIQNCTVTGFVHNVQDYLKAMDVFVIPSLTETTSLVTLEAMATGLPVIATKVGFIKSYIIKGYNGLFFSRNNATMLSRKPSVHLTSWSMALMSIANGVF